MDKIYREDILELTRRMTLKRNCFDRIAGAYMDEEGFVDGTFNRYFQRLTAREQQINLDIARTIPFSDTNVQLKEEVFRFLICAFCPVSGDYEPGKPECGFLFPAFKDRSGNIQRIDIFQKDGNFAHRDSLEEILFSKRA